MAIHKKQHDFASNSDHIFTALTNSQIVRLNSSGTAVESAGVTVDSFLSISGGTVTGVTNFIAGLSANTLSGGTILSGSTNLYNIFATAGSGVQTVGQGTNITTGGTATNPTINLVASPSINGLTASGTSNFTGALQSGGTDLNSLFVKGNGTTLTVPIWSGSSVLGNSPIVFSVANGTGLTTINSALAINGNLDVLGTATTFHTTTVSTTDNQIYLNLSGSYASALYGGIIILSGHPSGAPASWIIDGLGNWSADTKIIAGDGLDVPIGSTNPLSSGGTDLYNIFALASSGVHSVGANGNLSTGGTATNPTINLAASPSFNSVTASGTSVFNGGLSANTLSGGTILSGSTNLYSIFAPLGLDTTTASNGLTKSGNNVTLGGTLTATTTIIGTQSLIFGTSTNKLANLTSVASGTTNLATRTTTAGAGNGFLILNTGSTSYGLSSSVLGVVASTNIDGNSNTSSFGDSGTISSTLKLAMSGSTLGANDLLNFSSTTIDVLYTPQTITNNGADNRIIITDMMSSKGAVYPEDYSANFTLESLVTKRYVTSLVTGATSGSVISVVAGTNITTGGTVANPIVNLTASPSVNSITASGASSFTTLSATTMISGSTNLYSIFALAGSGVQSVGANGNLSTGGTATNPTINLAASPSFNSITASGASSFTTLSATTMISGSTNLYNIFTTGAHTAVQNGLNTYTGGTPTNPTVNVSALTINTITASGTSVFNGGLSANTLSGGTILSGSTNLYNIFATAGSGVQTVGQGTNITTGGTATNPTINLVASPSINGLTASGTSNFTGALQSGGTDLNAIFVDGFGTTNKIPLWLNGSGTLTDSIITQSSTGVTVAGSVNIIGDVNVLGTASTFNTQIVQSLDNNILLNYSGTYVSAIGGGITILSGTPGGASSTWSINSNGAWSANTGILTSAVTISNGNLTVNGGGAMISGSTDLYNIFTTVGSDLTTASNGLTKSGYNITLGGTLTGATTVRLGASALQLSGEGASNTTIAWSGAPYYTRLLVNGSGSQLKSTFGTLGDNFFIASDTTTMNFADGGTGNIMRLKFDGANMFVTDNVNSRGLEAAANYHAGYTNRTYVDKEYVDMSITGITSAITHTAVQGGSNIITGGTASVPTVNLVQSPSVNNFTASGNTSLQAITGTTIFASQFFQMAPYTGANPTSPNDNDVWFYSGTTGTISLNYKVGGVVKSVELA